MTVQQQPVQTVVIVGGGVSGVLTAIQVLRQAKSPLHVHLVEERAEVGLGVAYSTRYSEHLLNVPALGMSLFEDEPEHFVQWLRNREPQWSDPQDFAPRLVFGKYVRSVFEEALLKKPASVEYTSHPTRAVAVTPSEHRMAVQLANGETLAGERVVLALGNFPPANPLTVPEAWQEKGGYFPNPWHDSLYEGVEALREVLLIGSGLTALDVVVAYQNLGFTGKFHLVSTHGLVPRVHHPFGEHPLSFELSDLPPLLTTRTLYQLFKREMARADHDWRAVIQAFRSSTPDLWRRLPVREQALFMRRLAPWWNVHRHRVAPSIARLLEQLRTQGRFQVWQGRVAAMQPVAGGLEVSIQSRGGSSVGSLVAQRVVNCTGPQSDFTRLARHDSLIHSLLEQGLARPDALKAGLDALPNGRLFQADDQPSPHLFTLGTPMKGMLFECTSVPEIRQHAESLARELLKSDPEKIG